MADGYRGRAWMVERVGPVRVVRTAVYATANRGFARRLLNHLSFCASGLATAPLMGAADVVVVETPPLFTAGAGVAYAMAKRAPLIVNVADRWPASAVELGALRNDRAIRAASVLERLCYRRAAAITVPTKYLCDSIGSEPAAAGKVVHVPQSVDIDRFTPRPLEARLGPLRVLYAGTVGLAQGVDTVVEAAAIAGPDKVELTIAGSGAEAPEVRAMVHSRSIPNVRMLGVVPHERVPELYEGCDCAVVALRDRPLFAGAVPTKLLEGMASGRAIVLSARGEAAELVDRAGAGVVVAPEDPGALAAAFVALAGDPERLRRSGEAGRRLVVERFTRRRAVDLWNELLHEVA